MCLPRARFRLSVSAGVQKGEEESEEGHWPEGEAQFNTRGTVLCSTTSLTGTASAGATFTDAHTKAFCRHKPVTRLSQINQIFKKTSHTAKSELVY